MGVGVEGQHLFADVVLNEVQAAAGGGVVRIHQRLVTEGRGDGLALADDGLAYPLDQVVHGQCSRGGLRLLQDENSSAREPKHCA